MHEAYKRLAVLSLCHRRAPKSHGQRAGLWYKLGDLGHLAPSHRPSLASLVCQEQPGPDLLQEMWQGTGAGPGAGCSLGIRGDSGELVWLRVAPDSETVSAQVEVPGPKAGKDLYTSVNF